MTLTRTTDSIKTLDLDTVCLPAQIVVMLEVTQAVDVILSRRKEDMEMLCPVPIFEKMASIGQTQAEIQIRISRLMVLVVNSMIEMVTSFTGNLTNPKDQEDSRITSITVDSIREQIHSSLTQTHIIGLAHLLSMILDSSKK